MNTPDSKPPSLPSTSTNIPVAYTNDISQPQVFDPSAMTQSANMVTKSTIATKVDVSQMPKVSEVRKLQAISNTTKTPFDWRFLLPKYWGIWVWLMIFMPLIYLPLRWQFNIGKLLGKLIFRLAKRRRQDTLTNLRLTFPELNDDERLAMAEQVFINAGVGLFESLCAWYRPDIFTRQVTISGLQRVIAAQNAGKSVIILGAHYTMLDLGGRLASMFFPVDVVYRPQNNQLLEWLIYNARTRIYNDQIAHRDMRHLAKNIKQGHVIWYTPDQDFGIKQGVMANFFGVPAATLTAQRRLAKLGDKTNPPIILVVHFYRETPVDMPKGRKPHYHIQFSPILDHYPSDDELADAIRVNQMLENFIRIDPTQYMWFHRRFKTQPNGIKYYQ